MNQSLNATHKPDHETRASEDDHRALRLWLRLLTCTSLAETELRALLRTEFQTTLPRFDLLAQLRRVPEGLTMGELSKQMMVSSGNVTGIATQLMKEGLISRTPVPDNRRTFIAKLTPKGRRYFDKLAAKHESWIIHLMEGLDQTDMENMMTLLEKLKNHLQPRVSR